MRMAPAQPQRFQPPPHLLPAHGITSPIHTLHPPLRLRETQLLKELDVDIDAPLGAALARIDDLDAGHGLAVVRVVDGDCGAAERVAVGVGAVVHVGEGEGDDGFAWGGGDVAGGVRGDGGGGVIGYVAGVGGGEGDGDGEGEGGEGEGAGFHGVFLFCGGGFWILFWRFCFGIELRGLGGRLL